MYLQLQVIAKYYIYIYSGKKQKIKYVQFSTLYYMYIALKSIIICIIENNLLIYSLKLAFVLSLIFRIKFSTYIK